MVLLSLSPFRAHRATTSWSATAITRRSGAAPSQIEAIDMGRRGLHNEGSALLRERLEGKVEVDHDTARRLFTLICVLHLRG